MDLKVILRAFLNHTLHGQDTLSTVDISSFSKGTGRTYFIGAFIGGNSLLSILILTIAEVTSHFQTLSKKNLPPLSIQNG